MATAETGKGDSLEVRKTFAAPREKVFRAWTEPAAVNQWFPPPGYEAAPTDIDLRAGGTYRWGLRKLPDGEPFWTTGTFIEVDAPRRLVYTWLWSGAPESKATRHDRLSRSRRQDGGRPASRSVLRSQKTQRTRAGLGALLRSTG